MINRFSRPAKKISRIKTRGYKDYFHWLLYV